MKDSAKGFTLIELLAVIVILAVIALIATPLVLTIIDDAKKGADRDSAYGFIKAVQLSVSRQIMNNPATKFYSSCSLVINNRDITCTNSGADWTDIKIDYSGTPPLGGAISFATSGEIIDGTKLHMGTGWYTMTNGELAGPTTS